MVELLLTPLSIEPLWTIPPSFGPVLCVFEVIIVGTCSAPITSLKLAYWGSGYLSGDSIETFFAVDEKSSSV